MCTKLCARVCLGIGTLFLPYHSGRLPLLLLSWSDDPKPPPLPSLLSLLLLAAAVVEVLCSRCTFAARDAMEPGHSLRLAIIGWTFPLASYPFREEDRGKKRWLERESERKRETRVQASLTLALGKNNGWKNSKKKKMICKKKKNHLTYPCHAESQSEDAPSVIGCSWLNPRSGTRNGWSM